ncbi:MAG: hypothetical protein V1813_02870 [Candidatus Aenigmatarchaeota archaeon]
MAAGALDEIRKLNELYECIDVAVSGTADRKTEERLEKVYRGANASAEHAMSKRGLYPVPEGVERLRVETIDPEETGGLIGGYTSGGPVTINESIIPGTRSYGRFRNWMNKQRGHFSRYLYEKFGTDESAAESVRYTIGHETLHNKTQLRPMRTYDGKETQPFAEALIERLSDRYSENLPKGAKWLGKFMAHMTYKPLLEGLNEVASENVFNGEGTQAVKEKRSRGPTSYDAFASAAAGALGKIGYEEKMDPYYTAMDFYGDWSQKPGRMLDRYIDGFFESYASNGKGGCAGGGACYSMAPVQACLLKAA